MKRTLLLYGLALGALFIVSPARATIVSTGPVTCADTQIWIGNYTGNQISGALEGTQGAMGSAGYFADASSQKTVGLPTIARNGYYTGNYGVVADMQWWGQEYDLVRCDPATIPTDPETFCPNPNSNVYFFFYTDSSSGQPACLTFAW